MPDPSNSTRRIYASRQHQHLHKSHFRPLRTSCKTETNITNTHVPPACEKALTTLGSCKEVQATCSRSWRCWAKAEHCLLARYSNIQITRVTLSSPEKKNPTSNAKCLTNVGLCVFFFRYKSALFGLSWVFFSSATEYDGLCETCHGLVWLRTPNLVMTGRRSNFPCKLYFLA